MEILEIESVPESALIESFPVILHPMETRFQVSPDSELVENLDKVERIYVLDSEGKKREVSELRDLKKQLKALSG